MFSQMGLVMVLIVGVWFVINPNMAKSDRAMGKRNLIIRASIASIFIGIAFLIYLTANK